MSYTARLPETVSYMALLQKIDSLEGEKAKEDGDKAAEDWQTWQAKWGEERVEIAHKAL